MVRSMSNYILKSSLVNYTGLVLCGLFLSCGQAEDTARLTENSLALIGNRTIEQRAFVDRYNDFRKRTGDGVPDTYEARRQVLNLYVDEEILISEAERRGFNRDGAGSLEQRRIETQELLNLFNREMIAGKVTVSEDELKELFIRLNSRLRVRHLYAATRAEADSLHALVENGESFDALARQIFQDERLRDSGGLLGEITVDEMEAGFEDAAFGLAEGEVSQPVRTSDGYSIIRVDQRITKPLLTEHEYAKHKHKLFPYQKNRKIKQAMQAFSDSLSEALNISFDPAGVRAIYSVFARNKSTITNEGAISKAVAAMELMHSDLGTWTVGDFQERAVFTAAEHHARIQRVRDFEEFVKGLVVRDKILQLARRANLNSRSAYADAVRSKMDVYLLTRMEKQLDDDMVISEDSIRVYFERNASRFVAPAAINLREIVVQTKEDADLVARKLAGGADFAQLARTHSVRDWSAKQGGEIGLKRSADFGRWSDLVFSMQVGDRKGPVVMDSMYVFLECIAKQSERQLSLEEARADVVKAVRYTLHDEYRRAKINEIRPHIENISVLTPRLKSLKLM